MVDSIDFLNVLNDGYSFANLVGGGIAIGALAVVIAGLIGYTISKFIKLMIGRY